MSLGSPPHTWRKLPCVLEATHIFGITSTYVEKTWSSGSNGSLTEDHLHIRGENFVRCRTIVETVGSPPHTWRKLSSLC